MTVLLYDTDSELTLDLATKYGIENNVIRMPYTLCGEHRFAELSRPGDSKEFFDKIREGNMPTTAGLNLEEYKAIFEPYFKAGEDIFYISFSTRMSGTFAIMDAAYAELKKDYPSAKLVRYDTKAISMATGMLVIEGVKKFKETGSVEQTIDYLDSIRNKCQISIIVGDLMYLKRGGRLSSVKALLGGILQLKPIIKLTDAGTLIPTVNVAGRNKALKTILAEIVDTLDPSFPVVTVSEGCPDDEKRATEFIKAAFPQAEIMNLEIGPVIGTHCGPSTIGFCFFTHTERPAAKEE